MKNRIALLILSLSVLMSACSTVATPPNTYGLKHDYKQASGSEPVWIDQMNRYQSDHKDRKYFVGMADRELDMGMARQDAFANASKNIANGIKNTVHNLYVQAQTQDNSIQDYNSDVERAVEDGTLQVALGIITGARVDRYWWKEYWIQPEAGAPVQYYYDEFALVSMSLEHYNQTLYQTLNDTSKAINDPRAHHVIKKMEKLWLDKKWSATQPTAN